MHPKALLDSCAELLEQVLRFDHPADAVVSRYFREHRSLGPRERATLAETTYAALRRKLFYDHLAPSGRGPKARRIAILAFQGPRDFLKSALDEQERRWLDQCDSIDPKDLLDRQRHNLPEWLVDPLKAQLGDQFWPLVESLLEPAPLDLRVNAFTDKRDDVRQELKLAGIPASVTPYSPWGLRLADKPALTKLDAFARGAVEVQDEGSQLLALLLDAKRGEMVVDFCAGAGGKTLALGAAMRNTGRLYAFDISAHRLDALKPRLARSKLSNVHPAAITHERDDRIKRLAGKIDRVIVDAPCSGLGTLRRNPDLKWRQSPQAVAEMVVKQGAILASAARLLKPGGRLVYATCSVLPQENEEIAQAFGVAHPDFTAEPVADILDSVKLPAAGLTIGGEDGRLYLRLWPHRHQTDGFFAAAWRKS
jgi:16S rRNA (cytosine967-C5)-methyltransferase